VMNHMGKFVACGSSFVVCIDQRGTVRSLGNGRNGRLGYENDGTCYTLKEINDIPRMESVSCGDKFTVLLDDNGDIWPFGINTHANLGIGNYYSQTIPQKIPSFSKIVSISCGRFHTLCVDEYSSVWGFGRNDSGQLGLGHCRDVGTPQNIPLVNDFTIEQVSCGSSHSVIRDEKGEVYCTGYPVAGSANLQTSFVPIEGLDSIASISCGNYHTLLLTLDGRVFGYGSNSNYQLSPLDQSPPQIERSRNEYEDDRIEKEQYAFVPIEIEGLPKIDMIEAGNHHSLFVDTEGRLWILGDSTRAKFNALSDHGPCMTSIDQVHSIAISEDIIIIQDVIGGVYATRGIATGEISPDSTNIGYAPDLGPCIKGLSSLAKSAYK